jgi:hypothetical protein
MLSDMPYITIGYKNILVHAATIGAKEPYNKPLNGKRSEGECARD